MAGLKYCLLIPAVALSFFYEVNTIPSSRTELKFEREILSDSGPLNDDCIDQTDCDPYGPYMCHSPPKDKKWALACCREYCGFCNKTVPKNQHCDGTPPSQYQ